MSPVGLILLVSVTSGAAFKTNANVMKRFNEMLEACTLSPTAINCIDSASQRTLFRGVAAAQANPKVRNAFAVVYHDLGPVRVAGDLIFGQLKRTATEAADSCRVLPSEDDEALIAARELFDAIDTNDSRVLDKAELLASLSLLAPVLSSKLHIDCTADGVLEDQAAEELVNAFVAEADVDGDGAVSFVEWAKWLQLQGEEDAAPLNEALSKLHAQQESADNGSARADASKRARQTNGERFDEMLATCMQWEQQLLLQQETDAAPPESLDADAHGVDRLGIVMQGTFAGGHCEEIVAALRVCYEDYRPLRIGGDLIFRVLKTVVARRTAGAAGG